MKSFEGLDYAKLAEVTEQWPIIGRGDVYYGGTSYENKQGLGAQLTSAAGRGETYKLPAAKKAKSLRPKEGEVLAVPVTKLYDQGATVVPAELLAERIGEAIGDVESRDRAGVGRGGWGVGQTRVEREPGRGPRAEPTRPFQREWRSSRAVSVWRCAKPVAGLGQVCQKGEITMTWALFWEWLIKALILIFHPADRLWIPDVV